MIRFAIAVLVILGNACELSGEVEAPAEHAVIVRLKLSGGEFGDETERGAIIELERRMEQAIVAANAGEFDGNEIGEGQCTLYMYGPSADALFTAIAPVLQAAPISRGATVIKRAGPPGVPEERLEI